MSYFPFTKEGVFGMLSEREQQVYDAIKTYIDKHGFAPSMRELCKSVEMKSTATMQKYLDKLESEGYISRGKFTPRAISISKAAI